MSLSLWVNRHVQCKGNREEKTTCKDFFLDSYAAFIGGKKTGYKFLTEKRLKVLSITSVAQRTWFWRKLHLFVYYWRKSCQTLFIFYVFEYIITVFPFCQLFHNTHKHKSLGNTIGFGYAYVFILNVCHMLTLRLLLIWRSLRFIFLLKV